MSKCAFHVKRASYARIAFHVERGACADVFIQPCAFRIPHSASRRYHPALPLGGVVVRVLCVANQKGGVGKTTTAINLAACLAKSGQRTLVIDLDPQCNATTGLGQKPTARHPLVERQPLGDAVLATSVTDLQLLPGSRSFQDVDALAKADETQADLLRGHLLGELAGYDFVLIDCPPSLGTLTQTALSASTEVLMPIQCEYFAMEGLTQMIQVIRGVMRRFPGRLAFGGILLTMYDAGLELTHEVDAEVRDFFGGIVFETVIPRDVAAAEAPSHGRCVMDYAPRSRATRGYIELCMEVLERE
jgi:chromosome partitioning protein